MLPTCSSTTLPYITERRNSTPNQPHSTVTTNTDGDTPHPLTKYYGDPLSLDDAATHIRFYGLNVHGISPSDNYSEGQQLLEALTLLQVDVFGLQEINLNLTCPKTAYDVTSIFKSNNVGMKIQLSTSPELFPNRYKPGGTITGINSKLVGRVHSQGSDPVGRWSWITLHGKKAKKITIITAYRVCPGNLQSTDGTVWKQEWRALRSP